MRTRAREHVTANAPNNLAWTNGGAHGRKRFARAHSRAPRTRNGMRTHATADRAYGAAHARTMRCGMPHRHMPPVRTRLRRVH
eukprot:2147139-Pleurochrysis_carterae.AAC.1